MDELILIIACFVMLAFFQHRYNTCGNSPHRSSDDAKITKDNKTSTINHHNWNRLKSKDSESGVISHRNWNALKSK